MSEYIRRNVLGVVAIFIALGGTAAALPGKNQVDSGDIKKGQVKTGDLANAAVTNPKLAADAVDGTKVADNSLKGADVDEASLDIPQQAIPTSLPPSGVAGGDLSGSYPDPQVQESGLVAGGDLNGTVAGAQVSEAGLNAGGDLAGSTLANAQIAANGVGNSEIQDTTRTISIPASEVGFASLLPVDAPDTGLVNGFPALLFDAGTTETVNLLFQVPENISATGNIETRLFYTSASGSGSWRSDMVGHRVRPNGSQTLAAPTLFGTSSNIQPVAPANQLATTFGVSGGIGGVQPGDLIRLEISRTGADPNDTTAGDVAVHLIEITFPTTR